MDFIEAKEAERLEVLYHQHHDTKEVSYVDFLKVNTSLLSKDTLKAGDRVYLIDTNTKDIPVIKIQREKLW